MLEQRQPTFPGASTRLKQDMADAPASEPPVLPEPALAGPVRQADGFAPETSLAQSRPEPTHLTGVPEGTEVQVAPFAPPIAPLSTWPYWVAVGALVCSVPPAVFWLLSMMYVFGASGPFVGLMDALPTWLAVLTVIGLPVVSSVGSVLVLVRTSVGERGRLLAWLALIASVAYLFGLGLWWLDEFITNP